MKNILQLTCILLCTFTSFAQEYFPVNEGVQSINNNSTAFINAKIIVSASATIESGTLVIANGKIVWCGAKGTIPTNAKIVDLKGKSIYPSFIDLYTSFGVEKPKPSVAPSQSPTYDTKKSGFYWNEHIKSETNAIDVYKYDKSKADEFLKAGFGVVVSHQQDGIARGTGFLVALNNDDARNRILESQISNHFGFTKSVTSNQSYPNSLMGMMALLRQFYFDAAWYKNGNSTTKDASIEALIKNENLIQIFASEDKLNSLRAAKIGKEANIKYILKGIGNEFERVDEIKNTNSQFIIPIAFPEAFDVSDPYLTDQIEYSDLKYWNQAPTNLKVLSDNNIVFSLTTDKLKKTEDFLPNLQKAVKRGFDKTKAIEVLTEIPAKMIGKFNTIGSLDAGKQANFLICSSDIFDENNIIYENWVQGSKFVVNDMTIKEIRGTFEVAVDNQKYNLKIEGKPTALKTEISNDAKTKIKSTASISNNWITLSLKSSDTINKLSTRLSAYLDSEDKFTGRAVLYDGTETKWSAKRIAPFIEIKDSTKTDKSFKTFPVTYPNISYGNLKKPAATNILFKNATVWTNEKEGILPETDVLVKNGKIVAIAKNLTDASATVVDATNKHLSCGIIDEHSHVAISRGVNEGGHNSSAEVTIQDVVNSDDINIYRQLAGGVTTSQLLHGSANPIGGQSAIVKWKWGLQANEMLYPNQPKFIKFALGENVKQSNWGNVNATRFPQTRMGVEQVFTDYFQRAKEYDLAWKKFNADPKRNLKLAPRVDLELQTLAEILNKERFITCHSYVASEILMLMKVAKSFDFKVNTFTHILEGYKVADQMKQHGVAASTFSDWWGYKFEVNDAIPYNGPIMHKQGVLVGYNSDDAEMSRRLNQEAAKAVMYGNVSEEDAWKFVTLNPAKMLHIDDKVGSIKIGKDADLVLWSANPLSIYARVEQTLIEGVTYFDSKTDEQKRSQIQSERNDLINQMLKEKGKGAATQEPKKKDKTEYECDTLEK